MPRAGLQRRVCLYLAFNGLLLLWLLLKPGRHGVFTTVDNVAGTILPLIGALWCLWPDRGAARGRDRRASVLLGLGILCYAIGELIWAYYEVWRHVETPFPSWADAAFLLCYPCMLAGILCLPTRPLPAAFRGRVFVDSLMTMVALVTFSWYFLLGPNLLKPQATLLCKVLGAGYPLGDLVLLLCLLALAAHPGEAALRRAVPHLSLGMTFVVVADSLFGYMTLHDTYATGSLIDVLWPAGYMLIALGAGEADQGRSHARGKDGAAAAPLRNPVLWRSLLPYAFVPAVGALLLYTVTHRGDESLEPGVYLGSAVLIGLVLLRQVFALLENNRLNRYLREAYAELEEKNRLLEALANTDCMTGLANHRVFQERLRAELAAGPEAGLSVLLLDVDHFKQYNDAFGHPAGDGVLKAVAALLRQSVPGGAVAARYGGEEFAVVLPGLTGAEAHRTAEEIRAAVAAQPFPNRAVTLSIGLAHSRDYGADPEALISEADAALYAAKRAGRNRVHGAGPDPARKAA